MRLRPSARDEARAEIVDLLAWNPVVAERLYRSVDWSFKIAIGSLTGTH